MVRVKKEITTPSSNLEMYQLTWKDQIIICLVTFMVVVGLTYTCGGLVAWIINFPVKWDLPVQWYPPVKCHVPIKCYGRLQGDPNVCSGYGKCIGMDKCKCTTNYGLQCQYKWSNFGSDRELSEFNVASQTWKIIKKSRRADFDIDKGNNGIPNSTTCYGISSDNPYVCSGIGRCVGMNDCKCRGSYGPQCQYKWDNFGDDRDLAKFNVATQTWERVKYTISDKDNDNECTGWLSAVKKAIRNSPQHSPALVIDEIKRRLDALKKEKF